MSASPSLTQDGFRWRVVLGATLALIVGNGPVMQFTFGVFLKPLGDDLGLSRGTVSAALSVGLLGTALAAPFAGSAMDRFGTARIVLPSVLLFAAMLALQGLAVHDAVSLFVICALMGVAAAGQTPIGYARAIVSWFDRQRGLALGIAMTGVGIGTVMMPMLAAWLISGVGWRMAYVGLAGVLLVIAVPAVLLCIREGPAGRSASPAQARLEVRAARRTPTFLKLAVAFTLVAFAANGTIAHVVPMLTDTGVSPSQAAASLASIGGALICGRLFAGWLLDRMDAVVVTASFFASAMVGIALLGIALAVAAVALVPVALFLIGLGLGAEIDLLAFLVGRYFGTTVFGQLYGTLFSLFMVGSSIGPFAVGLSFDWFGSYRIALIALVGALAIAIALVASLKRVGTAV